LFKVPFEDWTSKVSKESAYCTFCGHQAAAQEFHTLAQWEYIKQAAVAHMTPVLGLAHLPQVQRAAR
jgi:hypothetical protein